MKQMTAMLCELCEAEESYNFHHFIPTTLHKNKWFKKRFTREQMRDGQIGQRCRGLHCRAERRIGGYLARGRLLQLAHQLCPAHVGRQSPVRWSLPMTT